MLLDFPRPLEKVEFVQRYKRFFADIKTSSGTVFPVHCANSGSMKSCIVPGADTYILDSLNPERKLRYSLEVKRLEDGLACLNTHRANDLVGKFLNKYLGGELFGEAATVTSEKYSSLPPNDRCVRPSQFEGSDLFFSDFPLPADVKKEVKFAEGTRFDFFLESAECASTWIEVKSVSLRLDAHTLAFPDAVTERGQKHLKELMVAAAKGHRAFLFFVVMRASDFPAAEVAKQFRPAFEIDPKYADLLNQALKNGVQVRTLVSEVNMSGLGIRGYFLFTGFR
jgi:sugar fermentation stimulation protein A